MGVDSQRSEFLKLKAHIIYLVGSETFREKMLEVKADNPRKRGKFWLNWIKTIRFKCPNCFGSKRYRWGANGKNSGPCYRCKCQGTVGWEDGRRCQYFDNNRTIPA